MGRKRKTCFQCRLMSKNSNISLQRKGIYILFLVVCFLLLAELIAGNFYYHQYGKRKLALVELYHAVQSNIKEGRKKKALYKNNYQYQQWCRPDSSETMNHRVFDEMIESNRFIFDSWLNFRNADYQGSYVNINGYERRTVPSFAAKGKDTVTIWFFGGSTMFGFNVTDAETIPSQLVTLYGQTNHTASLKVVNFSVPYYFSLQEYKLFSQLLDEQPAPDIAIFFDGLNDFWLYNNTYYRETYFTQKLASLFKEGVSELPSNSSAERTVKSDKPLSAMQTDTLLNNYLQATELIKRKSTQHGIQSLFVIQPVPFYQYPNKSKDKICSREEFSLYNTIYPALEQRSATDSSFIFFGNMLVQEKGLPFIDAIHYSPAFSKTIAASLLNELTTRKVVH